MSGFVQSDLSCGIFMFPEMNHRDKESSSPGGVVKDCIEDLGLSVTNAAKVLDVTRPTLSRVINGRAAISPEMSIRLSKGFGNTPEMWLRMQTAYDLATAYLDHCTYEEEEQDWRGRLSSATADLLLVAEDEEGKVVGYALGRPNGYVEALCRHAGGPKGLSTNNLANLSKFISVRRQKSHRLFVGEP